MGGHDQFGSPAAIEGRIADWPNTELTVLPAADHFLVGHLDAVSDWAGRVVGVSSRGGAYGENIRGPHRPTLDEMGPHAEQPLPAGKQPPRPTRTIEVDDPGKTKARRGRPRKTGRPGS